MPPALVTTLFAGPVRAMPGDGRPTGIFKFPLSGPVHIGSEGLDGDAQADRRVHGGPEKAVHHFPLENHRRLAARFHELAHHFVAGGMGENISAEGLDESSVYIGDVFMLGSVRMQVSQPRSPCWKIDARHGHEGIAAYIAETGIAGWYYRVLQPGTAQSGDVLTHVQRAPDAVSLRDFWDTMLALRPPPDKLERIAAQPGLNPAWQQKLQRRAQWLRNNSAS